MKIQGRNRNSTKSKNDKYGIEPLVSGGLV